MICNLHKVTYVDRCPLCTKVQDAKDAALATAWPSKNPPVWKNNALYKSDRTFSVGFRQKAADAHKLLLQHYGKLVDLTKVKGMMHAFSSGHMDDIFYVAPSKGAWANVVTALGGQQGPAYGEQGQFLGVWESYGCTTYSRLEIDAKGAAAVANQMDTMRGVLDDSKRIYLHGTDVDSHTLVHEMLHFVCHKEFYNRFSGNKDPQWKSINEGVTEYLTRRASPSAGSQSYEDEYKSVKLLLENGLGEADLQEAYFEGKIAKFEKALDEVNAMMSSVNLNVGTAKSLKFVRKGNFS